MHYELANSPPAPGSPQESAFLLIAKKKEEAKYFGVKSIIAAVVATAAEDSSSASKALNDAMEQFRKTLFPFLIGEQEKQDRDSKKVLAEWAKQTLKVRPLWRAQDNKPLISKLRRGLELVKKSEELRRTQRHRRI